MFRHLSTVFGLLTILTLACGSNLLSAKPTPPHGPIVVSEAAADQLKQNAYQALEEATTSNEAQLRFNNEQVTSLVALELTRTGQIPITNPQIWFTPNQIHLAGVASGLGPIDADVYITAHLNLQDGKIIMAVDEAKLGAFDFPETTLVSLTQTVNEALANAAWEIAITQVQIVEGEMIVTGKRQP